MYKMITGNETDEQILAPVKTAKAALLEATTKAVADDEIFHSRDLLRAAQGVVEAEAAATAAFTVRNAKRNGADAVKIREALMGMLIRGADDSWSGRENDSKRAAHDVVRRFVEDQFDHVRYGDQG